MLGIHNPLKTLEGNLTLLSKILTLLSTVFSYVLRNYWRNWHDYVFVAKSNIRWGFFNKHKKKLRRIHAEIFGNDQ